MAVESFLQLFCKEYSIHPFPEKSPQNLYQVPINETMTIAFSELELGCSLSSPLPPLSSSTKIHEALFIYLMRANFLGFSTGGGTIGLNEQGTGFVFSLFLPYELDYQNFRNHVEDFANYLTFWKEEVARYQKSLETPPS